ncbi:MAG: Acetyltransferase, GNAT family, partial [uncultured Corynebacteriales bacterium]
AGGAARRRAGDRADPGGDVADGVQAVPAGLGARRAVRRGRGGGLGRGGGRGRARPSRAGRHRGSDDRRVRGGGAVGRGGRRAGRGRRRRAARRAALGPARARQPAARRRRGPPARRRGDPAGGLGAGRRPGDRRVLRVGQLGAGRRRAHPGGGRRVGAGGPVARDAGAV